MNMELKIALLKNIYTSYDKFSKEVKNVCAIGCASCCTQNVSVTTLEAYYILEWLKENDKLDLLKSVEQISNENLSKPAITTNELAYRCLNQVEPPDEEVPNPSDPCPFLDEKEKKCLIYEVRPFGCRALFSEKKCDETGHAIVDPVLFTINSTLLQVVEHIDSKGLFANMIDMLVFLKDKKNSDEYGHNETLPPSNRFLQTRLIPGFIIPPDHEHKTLSVLNKLYNTWVGNTTFRDIIMGTGS
ncbi:MAG: YkgJ family cysteine cluster protein [Deltaproteobacteria bacterium]|nr:YkgJ family cysteine cluster protein [Deltaproteobacteria bacterium]